MASIHQFKYDGVPTFAGGWREHPRPEARVSVRRRLSSVKSKPKNLVWRRKTHQHLEVERAAPILPRKPTSTAGEDWGPVSHLSGDSGDSMRADDANADLGEGSGVVAGRPRRRRPRKRRRSTRRHASPTSGNSLGGGLLQALDINDPQASTSIVSPCIMGWSNKLSASEDDLRTAVVLTIISDLVIGQAEIAALLAPRLNIIETSLVIRRISSSSLLLILPDITMIELLISRWSIIRTAMFSVICKRWTRFLGASGVAFPYLVDLEIGGILVHAWETSTVEHLLSPFAWIHQVHQDTLALQDLSCFRCSAWCTNPSTIPASRDFWIVESVQVVEGNVGETIALSYPITIRFSVAFRPNDSNSHSGPPTDNLDDGAQDHAHHGLHQGQGATGDGRSNPFMRDGRNLSLGRSASHRSGPRQLLSLPESCSVVASELQHHADPLLDCLLVEWEIRQTSRISIDSCCFDISMELGGSRSQPSDLLRISTASRD
jgi:hypothetical protein